MNQFIPCPKCNNKSRMIANNPQRALYRCVQCRGLTEINHIPEITMRFMCFNHQGKADMLIHALESKYEQYHGQVSYGAAMFALADSDVTGRIVQFKRMRQSGVKRFFIYPHAARPSLINAHYPTWEGTTAQFVVNEYHAEVLREYGYAKPLEPMGWHLSPVEDFKPRNCSDRPVKVLFAPIHPRNAQIDRQMNYETFTRLYRCVLSGDIELTIRHIGEIQESGLPNMQGVTYVNGTMNQATHDMDNADVVIAHQTFAWLAVARGIPCVMFAEDMPVHFRENGIYRDVECWSKIHHLFRYPLDLLCEDNTLVLLRRAAQSDNEIADWKRRMIGDAFDPKAFIQTIEKYL